ncbi:MAG: bifunctional diaminohydroxyphosphoribosylaminopyrimidine deaminase/5-amino-6-(5-phosphoribosylamino)uracil reductase RibD [Methanobacteriota archaeon]|nr:MAG: bifunctional diaminohydroxyphosphoribosylaminopyrimidine deaminase/5-amino-6-(5-phosphoribosylamino)uracil reductase RibD [Euryarchaeota archaeon]|tara:strand:- start:37014 stop:38138 length:1125 start_codon:yes stop_codon:yes gene_type:complete
MDWSKSDIVFMERALEVAERGRGDVNPNPLVGCILVKDGEIISEGWHNHLGGLHAEQMAIANAEKNGKNTNGSTAYVTLEPCNHHGRTPPCTEALLWAGIKEVIISHIDPNPTVKGGGIDALKKANINVKIGLLEEKSKIQMESFLNWCEKKTPLVTLKMATDCDGNIDDISKSSKRFSSETTLNLVHKLRSFCDAILVGVNTVIRDNPELNVRRITREHVRNPLRIVMDRNLRIPHESRILNDGNPTLIVYSKDNTEKESSLNIKENVELLKISENEDYDGINPADLLIKLGERGIQELLIEGGTETARKFVKLNLIDRVLMFRSPISFKNPIKGLTGQEIVGLGLQRLPDVYYEDDCLERWVRNSWPADNWP